MGRVELAVREEGVFRRIYAIKRLRESFGDDEAVRKMFLDEARIAGMIHHPNVVSVLDVGTDEAGPYLVMDFVRGISASELLKWGHARGELFPVSLCVRIVRQIADGLHAAHELRDSTGKLLQVVHRDVSPQNILLGYDGAARLADFGVARARGRISRTHTGVLKGKYGYMAPEQLRFEEPDRRADLFSLGVLFYELLSSDRLYRRDDAAAAARAILNDPPPDIDEVRKDVHPVLVELLFRMLAKDPDDRPETGREVVRILDEVLAQLALDESPVMLDDFLGEHFGEKREAQTVELEQLRTKIHRSLTDDVRLVEEHSVVTNRIKPKNRSMIVGLISVVTAAAAVVLVMWGMGAFQAESAPPLEVAAEPAASEDGSGDVPSQQAVDPDVSATTAAPEAGSIADQSAEEPPEERARDTRRRARARDVRSRMRPRSGRMQEPSKTELYDWGQ